MASSGAGRPSPGRLTTNPPAKLPHQLEVDGGLPLPCELALDPHPADLTKLGATFGVIKQRYELPRKGRHL